MAALSPPHTWHDCGRARHCRLRGSMSGIFGNFLIGHSGSSPRGVFYLCFWNVSKIGLRGLSRGPVECLGLETSLLVRMLGMRAYGTCTTEATSRLQVVLEGAFGVSGTIAYSLSPTPSTFKRLHPLSGKTNVGQVLSHAIAVQVCDGNCVVVMCILQFAPF